MVIEISWLLILDEWFLQNPIASEDGRDGNWHPREVGNRHGSMILAPGSGMRGGERRKKEAVLEYEHVL